VSGGAVTGEEQGLYQGAAAAFGLNARFRTFFVESITGYNASDFSLPPYCATGSAIPEHDRRRELRRREHARQPVISELSGPTICVHPDPLPAALQGK
jgi:hypothetical protein